MKEFRDYKRAKKVEITIAKDRSVWVNINWICVLRAKKARHVLVIDRRKK